MRTNEFKFSPYCIICDYRVVLESLNANTVFNWDVMLVCISLSQKRNGNLYRNLAFFAAWIRLD